MRLQPKTLASKYLWPLKALPKISIGTMIESSGIGWKFDVIRTGWNNAYLINGKPTSKDLFYQILDSRL